MVKKVLITGAGGFIGTEFVNGLSQLDYEVYALDRHFHYPFLKKKNIHKYEIDLISLKKNKFINIDYIVHAAAITSSVNDIINKSLLNKNLLLTKKSLNLAKELKANFFLISSTGVYSSNKKTTYNEKSKVYFLNDYSKSKLLSEKITSLFCKKNNLDFKIFRLGNTYNGEEKKNWSRKNISMFQKWHNSSKKNSILKTDSFDTKRDWTYAKDIPVVFDKIIKSKNKKIKIINLVSPYIKKDIQMMKIISQKIKSEQNFKESSPI